MKDAIGSKECEARKEGLCEAIRNGRLHAGWGHCRLPTVFSCERAHIRVMLYAVVANVHST